MATADNKASISGGKSLEEVLFRHLDRFTDEHAIVDREEFAAHLEEALGIDELASEHFVERFFAGDPVMALARPADRAAAVVQASRKRLQAYEFDLDRYEYVVLEEDDKVVVVSGMGAFSVQNDDFVSSAIERAVIPDQQGRKRDSAAGEPRAYLVKRDGRLVALDVPKLT